MKNAFSSVIATSLPWTRKMITDFPPYFFLPSFRERRKYHRQQKCSQNGFRKTKGLFPLLLLLLFVFCCRCSFSHLLKAFFIYFSSFNFSQKLRFDDDDDDDVSNL